jgi:hypothetical protein
MSKYRCFEDRQIHASVDIEAADDPAALVKAELLLTEGPFTTMEIQQGPRFVGGDSWIACSFDGSRKIGGALLNRNSVAGGANENPASLRQRGRTAARSIGRAGADGMAIRTAIPRRLAVVAASPVIKGL